MAKFYTRLNRLGFKKYKEYLNSDYWKKQRKRYLKSNLLKECIVCGNKKYQLHHKLYKRIGKEKVSDFLPLCNNCHLKLHQYLKTTENPYLTSKKTIRKAFGLTRKETKKLFTKLQFGWVFNYKNRQRG